MFTGLVKATEKVISNTDEGGFNRLVIARGNPSIDYGKIDDSVAVNGTCLTIVDSTKTSLSFDILPESLRRTNLKNLKAGDFVNTEPALKAGDFMGGHNVQGHIDGTAQITAIAIDGEALNFDFALDNGLAKMNIPKGFIAIDGISLTLTHIHEQGFSVMLIPHTQNNTCARFWQKGTIVNIEIDAMAKMVFQFIQHMHNKTHNKGDNNE